MKRPDPYYRSAAWAALRAACLRRDGYRCTTPGCGSMHRLTADHLTPRRSGGTDTLDNLTTRCAGCDASVKEDSNGKRRGTAVPVARGCHADGTPRSPSHWWNAPRATGENLGSFPLPDRPLSQPIVRSTRGDR